MRKLLCALLSVGVAVPAVAQSLRGSQSSVQKMYTRAVRADLDFYSTSKSVYQSVKDGELKLVSITMDLTLDKVSYPFVLPRTLDVLNVFARNYRQACGERLVVTSAARPRREQPRNASPQSVHPTGMAIDFRRPQGECLTYMRGQLLALEKLGILEATEERHPVHFHVAVLQRGNFAPVTRVASTDATRLSSAPFPEPVATVASTDSAAGTVALPDGHEEKATKPAPKAAPNSSTYIVKKGDNLSVIARRFGISVTRLKAINGLKSSMLRPGQRLKTG